jgi:hypothetical protein
VPARPAVPLVLALTALALAAPARARAGDPFEIQVYTADLAEPGQLGLELHLNYTMRGETEPAYPGEVPPDGAFRLTFEPQIGVTPWLELGAYAQLLAAPGGTYEFGGWKARAKLVVPEQTRRRLGWPFFLGVNVELSNVPASVAPERWGTEIRPIVGWEGGRWLVSVNPILGFSLTGPDRFQVDLEPAAKVAWNTGLGFAVGAEYYASLGRVTDVLPASDREHLLFAVLDLAGPPEPTAEESSGAASEWELNLAFGAGLTDATPQHAIVKAIVGRSF